LIQQSCRIPKITLNISNIVSAFLIKNVAGKQTLNLRPLGLSLVKVSHSYIQILLVIGLVLAFVMSSKFCCSIFGPHLHSGNIVYQQGLSMIARASLIVGLLCCISSLMSTIILYELFTKAQGLRSIVKTIEGVSHCLGAFCPAVVMTLLAAFTQFFMKKCTAGLWTPRLFCWVNTGCET